MRSPISRRAGAASRSSTQTSPAAGIPPGSASGPDSACRMRRRPRKRIAGRHRLDFGQQLRSPDCDHARKADGFGSFQPEAPAPVRETLRQAACRKRRPGRRPATGSPRASRCGLPDLQRKRRWSGSRRPRSGPPPAPAVRPPASRAPACGAARRNVAKNPIPIQWRSSVVTRPAASRSRRGQRRARASS